MPMREIFVAVFMALREHGRQLKSVRPYVAAVLKFSKFGMTNFRITFVNSEL